MRTDDGRCIAVLLSTVKSFELGRHYEEGR